MKVMIIKQFLDLVYSLEFVVCSLGFVVWSCNLKFERWLPAVASA